MSNGIYIDWTDDPDPSPGMGILWFPNLTTPATGSPARYRNPVGFQYRGGVSQIDERYAIMGNSQHFSRPGGSRNDNPGEGQACNICGNDYPTFRGLRIHQNRMHGY